MNSRYALEVNMAGMGWTDYDTFATRAAADQKAAALVAKYGDKILCRVTEILWAAS